MAERVTDKSAPSVAEGDNEPHAGTMADVPGRPEGSSEVPETENARSAVERWRAQVLDTALAIGLATVCLVALVLVLHGTRGSVALGIGVIPAIFLIGLALAKKDAPLHLRAYGMVLAFWLGIAVAGFQRAFSIPNPFVGAIFVCVLAALVFDRRRMWLVLAGTVAIFAAQAVAWVRWLTPIADDYSSPHEPANWMRVLLIFGLFGAGTMLAIAHLVRNLEDSLTRAEDLVFRLQVARRQAEAAKREAEHDRRAAEEANEAKSRFLATMSHDIRTPLTAVVGIAEVVRESDLDETQREQIKVLSGASQMLLALVDDILDLSRVSSGLFLLEAVPVDLEEVVAEVEALFAAGARERGLTLRCSHRGEARILGDSLRIRQILTNLVGNALKFTQEGEVVLESEGRLLPDGQSVEVMLTVRDTGIGMTEDEQRRVFEPFTQAAPATARVSGGSGLGLSIVRGLATLMGGEVALESRVGEGSTFLVRLQAPVCAQVRDQQVSDGAASHRACRVLLADDNPTNRVVIGLMLENLGCEVLFAEDGEAAVELALRDSGLELVLMDCMMPVMDGLEATRALRAKGSELRIVALTANATPEDRDACRAAGMDDFATKPLTLPALRSILDGRSPVAVG